MSKKHKKKVQTKSNKGAKLYQPTKEERQIAQEYYLEKIKNEQKN